MNRHDRRAAKRRTIKIGASSFRQEAPAPECTIEFTEDGCCFFVVNGQRMAERKDRHWVPLVEGFEIHDNLYGGGIDDLDECQGRRH